MDNCPRPVRFLAVPLVLVLGASCAAEPAPSEAEPAPLDDPSGFCAAVGTADEPEGAGYTGPKVPDWMARALWRASGGVEDADEDTFSMAYLAEWRCVDGAVLACSYGANIPCGSKADTETTPGEGALWWCRENPDAEWVPVAATGRSTVFSWRCVGTRPMVERQWFSVDARGYQVEFWYRIDPGMGPPGRT
jgi:hypothetical protein